MKRQVVLDSDDVLQACLSYVRVNELITPAEGEELLACCEFDINDQATGSIIVSCEKENEIVSQN